MANVGIEASERLAKITVKETGYDKVEDKVLKNIFSTKNVFKSIKYLKTVG